MRILFLHGPVTVYVCGCFVVRDDGSLSNYFLHLLMKSLGASFEDVLLGQKSS